jgi:hypothetical protein
VRCIRRWRSVARSHTRELNYSHVYCAYLLNKPLVINGTLMWITPSCLVVLMMVSRTCIFQSSQLPTVYLGSTAHECAHRLNNCCKQQVWQRKSGHSYDSTRSWLTRVCIYKIDTRAAASSWPTHNHTQYRGAHGVILYAAILLCYKVKALNTVIHSLSKARQQYRVYMYTSMKHIQFTSWPHLA